MVYSIDITAQITSAVQALRYGIGSNQGRSEIGRAVMDSLRSHWMTLNAQRHRGLTKLGYYEDAARNTDMELVPGGVDVYTSKQGLNLRIYGGVVTPGKHPSCVTGKPTKYLTIPAIAEAYGRTACDFGKLQFVRFGKSEDSPAALIESNPGGATMAATGKRVRKKIKSAGTQGAFGRRVFFWLVKSTTHKPDPSVMPDVGHLESIAAAAAERYAERLMI